MSKTQWHNPTSATEEPGVGGSLQNAYVKGRSGEAQPPRHQRNRGSFPLKHRFARGQLRGNHLVSRACDEVEPPRGNKAAIALALVQQFSAPASWQLL